MDTALFVRRLDQVPFLLNCTGPLFFQPVEFDFQLSDWLVKRSFQRFFFCRHPDTPRGENFRQTCYRLFFPLIHLIRMNPLLTTQFVARALAFEGFQHDFDFDFGAIRGALLLVHCCSFGRQFTP